MIILVTGGAGYIGSHTCVDLLENNYEVVIVDNLYNSNEKAVERIAEITGKKPAFYEVDLLDKEALDSVFDKENIDAVIHFAGLKAVGESVEKPIEYYHNNITGTLHLHEEPQREKYHFQFVSDRLRKSCFYPDHRRMSEGIPNQSVWLDQMDVRTNPYRPAHR